MAVLKCKMCGGAIEINKNMTLGTCMYCGSTMTVPRIDNEKKARLFNHANQYRLNNEFDKAYDAYQAIVDENEQEAEAYWGLILSEYGVEYVEDPKTKKRIPTCHRTRVQAIQNSTNYELACKYADAESRFMYQDEAEVLDRLQKKIISISAKEEPYDVFICYKETNDETGERTEDSVLAQEIYNELTKQGLRVFFSRISLEDKLGSSYEPYIYAALQSSSIMLHVTTASEHSNAIWVKNEWRRYIDFMSEDDNKTLIPVYRNISPYELPAELTKYQAQDMSKVGAIQDLIYGVQKLVKRNKNNTPTSLGQREMELLNELERRQEVTEQILTFAKRIFSFVKLFFSFATIVIFTFWGIHTWLSSSRYGGIFYTPKGYISILQLPGPSILGLPLLSILVPLLFDIALTCHIIRGVKSKIAQKLYFGIFVVMTILIGILYIYQIRPTMILWVVYVIIVFAAVISTVITYWHSKKKLFVLFLIYTMCILAMVSIFLTAPSQSDERNTSVNQIKITENYIELREKPSPYAKIIGGLYWGEIYTVLDSVERDEYMCYKIRTTHGSEGYVLSGYDYVEYLPAK